MTTEAVLAALLAAGMPGPAGPNAGGCPEGMVLVEGVHRDQVQRLCSVMAPGWHCMAFVPGLFALESRETPVRVCMDRYEYPNREGVDPVVMVQAVGAKATCAKAGKRLCTEYEWETACEGPDMRPFPYGWAHDATACHTDDPYRTVNEKKLTSADPAVRDAETKRLWQGEPSGARPRCESAAGVRDLVGNVEEWVATSRPEWQYPMALKGGFWSKPWAGCRGTNDSHGPLFRFYEVGFRCCADPS